MNQPVIITVGGGKGGVGKSFVSANLGTTIAQSGRRVGFVDADLGGANLHMLLGVRRPKSGLQEFLAGKARTLDEVAIETVVPNTWLVSGVGEGVRLANPTYLQKQKIANHIRKMQADVILVDLGAGADFDITDFYASFPYGIVVSDSMPTSIENAYAYLKNGIIRGLCHLFPGDRAMQTLIRDTSDPTAPGGAPTLGDMIKALEPRYPQQTQAMRRWLHERKTFLVINMVKENEDITVGRRFVDIVKRYLSIDMFYIGYVVYSPEARRSIKAMKPAVLSDSGASVRDCFGVLARNLAALTQGV